MLGKGRLRRIEVIGRDEAMAGVRRALGRAALGDSGALLVVADAGLGKTRLIEQARSLAVEFGCAVHEGSCLPGDRAEPLAPLVDMVRAVPGGSTGEDAGPGSGAVATAWLPILNGLQPAGEEQPRSAEQGRATIHAALTRVLFPADDQRPALMLVDDLHWCDHASLDYLLALLRRPPRPLLVVGTYRPGEESPHLREWLEAIERARLAESLHLLPLSPAEVARMATALLGGVAPPARLLDLLHNLAEGNPLFVEELLTSFAATGGEAAPAAADHGLGPLVLPAAVRGAIRDRVSRLTPRAREVVQIAATIGRRFDYRLVQQIVALEEPALLAVMDELVAAHLLVEESGDRFAFRHALTREAVYGDLLERTRALLHRQVAEALEHLAERGGDVLPGDLAARYFHAREWDKAQVFARQAGERALRIYAWQAAIEQFDRALAANRHLMQIHGLDPGERLLLDRAAAATYRGRARAFAGRGQFAPARADLEAALALARAGGDRREIGLTLLDAGVDWAAADYVRAGRNFREALELAEAGDDAALLVEALNRMANWHANVAEPDAAVALLQRSLSIVERSGNRAATARTLDWLGTLSYLRRDLAGAVAYLERALTIFRGLDDRPALASCLALLCARGGSYDQLTLCAGPDQVAAGVRDGEEALALARSLGAAAAEAFALVQLAAALGPRGAYGRAFASAEQALALARSIDHGGWIQAAHTVLGALALDLLRPAEALTHLQQARERARELGSRYWEGHAVAGMALALLELHEPERAAALLDEAAGDHGGHWWVDYANARLALDRRNPAAALPWLEHDAVTSGAERSPLAARLHAETLAALGRSHEAEALLRSARATLARQGTRSELWRVMAALGDLLRAAGQAEEARREYAAARSLIETLAGEMPDAAMRGAFLERATQRLPRAFRLTPRAGAAARAGGLTAREREVATLLARGKTNSEIATALVLGRRTVETHVANIMTKLGCSSRREIGRLLGGGPLTNGEPV